MPDVAQLMRKLKAAIAFGTPEDAVAEEILDEVQAVLDANVRLEQSVMAVRECLDKLAMARSNDPDMSLGRMLSTLAEMVDGVCEAVNYE